MNKNTKIFITMISVILIVVFACILLFMHIQKKPQQRGEAVDAQKTDMLEVERMADACYKVYLKAVSEGLNLGMEREQCYIEVAVKFKDALICEKIEDQNTKDSCLNEVGILNKDLSVCEKIVGDLRKNNCFDKIRYRKNDPFICSKMLDWERKRSCYENNAKLQEMDSSLCDNENLENDKNLCLYMIAIEKKEPLICKDISVNDEKHKYAVDNCIKVIATENKNPITCSYMENKYNKLDCYRYIAPFKNEGVEFCQNELNDIFDKDICFKAVASIKKDPSICVNVVDENMRESCRKYAN